MYRPVTFKNVDFIENYWNVDFYCDEFIEKYGIGAAKNDTFIEQVRYEISTDKSNESIHLELSTPTYAKMYEQP